MSRGTTGPPTGGDYLALIVIIVLIITFGLFAFSQSGGSTP